MVYLDTLNFFVNKYKWVGAVGRGGGANPLLPNSSQTINFFQKAIMQDEYW